MANLLFDYPERWFDSDGISPPACWDGTQYNVVVGSPQYLEYKGAAAVNDYISIYATWQHGLMQAIVRLNISDVGSVGAIIPDVIPIGDGLVTYVFSSAGSFVPDTDPDFASDTDIVLSVGLGYGGESTSDVIAMNGSPVAPDVSITVDANSTGNIIAPVIMQGGIAVTPLTFLSYGSYQPAHGHVTPADFSENIPYMTYTPTAGYTGPDVFYYYGYNGDGIGTNLATATVTVVPSAAPSFWTDFVQCVEK